jgi:hypothetical protein
MPVLTFRLDEQIDRELQKIFLAYPLHGEGRQR